MRERDRDSRAPARGTPCDQSQLNGGSRGFTLVELLITVAIIGLLAAMAVANLNNALDKSRQRQTMATMRNVSTAVEAYNTDNGHLPANGITADQLKTLLVDNVFKAVEVQDGWDSDLVYTASDGAYTLESYGRDRANGPQNITRQTRDEFEYDILLADGQFKYSPET